MTEPITDHVFRHDPQDHAEPTPHVCQLCERPLEGHWWRCVNPTTEPVLRDAVRALVDDLEGAARGALSTTLPHSRRGAADRARLYRDLAARLAEALAES